MPRLLKKDGFMTNQNNNAPGIGNQPSHLDQQLPVIRDPFAPRGFDRVLAAGSYGANIMAPAGVAALYNAGHVGPAQVLSAGVNGMAMGQAGMQGFQGSMAPYGMGGGAAYGFGGAAGLGPNIPGGGGNDPFGKAEADLNASQFTMARAMGIQIQSGTQNIMFGTISQVEKAKHDTESQITRNI